MNACTGLKSEAEGADYIRRMLNRHGSLATWVRGVHLHQSLSGEYVKAHTGLLPAGLPEDYGERFGAISTSFRLTSTGLGRIPPFFRFWSRLARAT